ncbi:hypothetical protein Pfo_010198 [Paulownia fortunei]|nr:hypothetical protein Pfo_010198 [Paulownia fortunei]
MSANEPLLQHRHHSHGRQLSLRPENFLVKPMLSCTQWCGISRVPLIRKCAPGNLSAEWPSNYSSEPPKIQEEISFLTILKGPSSFMSQVVISRYNFASYTPTFIHLVHQQVCYHCSNDIVVHIISLTYYTPALGSLMSAVGVNSSEKDFLEFVLKPILGYLFGTVSMTIFGLPTSLAAGIMLTSCVSWSQLSSYATFLIGPAMAPLSIVMTSLSSATAVFVTPFLSLLLNGQKLPVDVKRIVSNIPQIVITPIATQLFCPKICNAIRPLLPPLSVFVIALCLAFISEFAFTGLVFHDLPDAKALQRMLFYETGHCHLLDIVIAMLDDNVGMQSNILALAHLQIGFSFQDPLVSIPPAISLSTFDLYIDWADRIYFCVNYVGTLSVMFLLQIHPL